MRKENETWSRVAEIGRRIWIVLEHHNRNMEIMNMGVFATKLFCVFIEVDQNWSFKLGGRPISWQHRICFGRITDRYDEYYSNLDKNLQISKLSNLFFSWRYARITSGVLHENFCIWVFLNSIGQLRILYSGNIRFFKKITIRFMNTTLLK